jgi:NAD(P)-dependent dehydrogenase (short-subunit alcohol dehydrogenase family)
LTALRLCLLFLGWHNGLGTIPATSGGEMSTEFSGKVVVVTGGSRGIGRAVALAFARAGAQTVLAASSADNLAAAAKMIRDAGGGGGAEPLTVAADLRDLEGCTKVLEAVRARHGRCDVLVNSAGATRAGNFLDLADAAWLDGYALKLFACVRTTRLFWPLLKEARGHVVNIVGGAARTPGPQFLIGGSVNAAMANFSKGLSQLGRQDGVNVNVIHPGATDTERTQNLMAQRAAASGKSVEEVRAETVAKEGRLAKPEEIAALALFLCSQDARHIQGQAIGVDGGGTPGYY